MKRYCELKNIPEIKDLKSGMNFRRPEYRREVFLRFYEFHLKYKAHAGAIYYAFPYIFKELKMNMEQKLLFAFINGCTQNVVTTYFIFQQIKDLKTYNPTKFSLWFRKHYDKLGWDTDRRYVKNKLEDMISSYAKKMEGTTQEEYFKRIMTSGDKYKDFKLLWHEVEGTFEYFGRLATFSYLEYLKIAGLNIDCDELFLDDIEGSKSHRNGLCKVLGRDDLDNWKTKVNYTPEIIEWLKKEGEILLEEARQRFPHEDLSYFTLETTLCCYKSWHRPNRRYPNVYNDMFYERIKYAEQKWNKKLDIFWRARAEYLPDYLRLECNPKDLGVHPIKQNHYLKTGEVIMMEREWECFSNKYAKRIAPEDSEGETIFPVTGFDREEVKWEEFLKELTPVEKVGDIYFKREDYFAPLGYGSINGSKLRQCIWLIDGFRKAGVETVISGSVVGSPQHPFIASICKHYGLKSLIVTGAKGVEGHKNLELAQKYGSDFKFVNITFSSALQSLCFKEKKRIPKSEVLETNITLNERLNSYTKIEQFHRIGSYQVQNIPDHIEIMIIPCGSCNSVTSVLYGLFLYPPKNLKKIILMGIGNNGSKDINYVWRRLEGISKVINKPELCKLKDRYLFERFDLEGEGFCTYADTMPYNYKGLKFHPRYEGKIFNYMMKNLGIFKQYLNEKTLFWIVGSEPTK